MKLVDIAYFMHYVPYMVSKQPGQTKRIEGMKFRDKDFIDIHMKLCFS
jgi:hypothetical protein